MCICMYVAYILHICIPVEVYSFHPHTNRVYVHIYTGNGMHTHERYVHRCGPTFRTFMFKPDISILNRFFFFLCVPLNTLLKERNARLFLLVVFSNHIRHVFGKHLNAYQ